ncbi:hypothetical Protein YC6258_01156 [Gynuella sunshinyii YC6258]|uniref:Uncharacterized protein n=1 Tax=Gynuella sunshinyii YC6258 TaxID=1445510 RepID=A0A0C5VSF3_9GAMM|nr:hypothetical Protein YC6258_01156 [Gynuella sunshinyii YC6258]
MFLLFQGSRINGIGLNFFCNHIISIFEMLFHFLIWIYIVTFKPAPKPVK